MASEAQSEFESPASLDPAMRRNDEDAWNIGSQFALWAPPLVHCPM
jgi:hypothetical protein